MLFVLLDRPVTLVEEDMLLKNDYYKYLTKKVKALYSPMFSGLIKFGNNLIYFLVLCSGCHTFHFHIG